MTMAGRGGGAGGGDGLVCAIAGVTAPATTSASRWFGWEPWHAQSTVAIATIYGAARGVERACHARLMALAYYFGVKLPASRAPGIRDTDRPPRKRDYPHPSDPGRALRPVASLLSIDVPLGAPVSKVRLGRFRLLYLHWHVQLYRLLQLRWLLRHCRHVFERRRHFLMACAPRHRERHCGADQKHMAQDSHGFAGPRSDSGSAVILDRFPGARREYL